jgi:membrane protease YdiL (CAAX protease family)
MSQTTRLSQAALFIASWMALGWCFHLDPYAYLLLGIPFCILFQLFVRRQPLSSCWVRDTSAVRLDVLGILLALGFMVVPVWQLRLAWPHSSWMLRLYFFASMIGAVGVAFALRRFNRTAIRSLLLCLVTAGVLGCGWMLLAAFAQQHRLSLTPQRLQFAASQFLVLLPVCFVMEEVAFRGVLDSHIQHPQDSRPWLSALLLSAMWGWWHLPVVPTSLLGIGLIAFPITHAILGIPLSLFWRRSGNLLVPAAVHALIDAVRNAWV